MQRVWPIVRPDNTLEETRQRLAAAPALRAYLAGLSRSGRSKLKDRLAARGYPRAQVDEIIPAAKVGRPARPAAGPFEGLSLPMRSAISDAIGADFPTTLDGWDDVDTAGAAATAIVDHYTNPTSAAVALSHLRNGLRALGASPEVVAATLRPAVTEAHNARAEERRAERAAEGLTVPPPFMRIGDLRERVARYLAAGAAWVPDGQAAADLLVALSARPGEASTLDLGERGGVVGVLKKRGAADAYNLVSALGEETARALLAAWKRSDAASRRAAMRDLGDLVQGWGVQRRDLRAIGAFLAARAGVLAGEVQNAVAARDVAVGALRHEAGRRAAVDHYQRVNDPVAQLCARLGELGAADLEQVRGLLARLGRR